MSEPNQSAANSSAVSPSDARAGANTSGTAPPRLVSEDTDVTMTDATRKRSSQGDLSDSDSDGDDPVGIVKRLKLGGKDDELSFSKKERLLVTVVDALDKGWKPLDPTQNPPNDTDFWRLLEQFNRAWKFRDSMVQAFSKVLFGQWGAISEDRAVIFAVAVEQALNLGSAPNWRGSVYAKRLYACRSIADFEQVLWGCHLINPAALMAKVYALAHPDELPSNMRKELTFERLWLEFAALPFCGGAIPYLFFNGLLRTWPVALRYGVQIISHLMDLQDNWWRAKPMEISLDQCQAWERETNMLPQPHALLLKAGAKPEERIAQSVDPQALQLMNAFVKLVVAEEGNKQFKQNTQSTPGGKRSKRGKGKRRNASGANGSASLASGGRCHTCSQFGHYAINCPQKSTDGVGSKN